MKISIIMPTYNDSSTIIDTIDSVANQSYSNWQLIIMNDGSTDNVEDVLMRMYMFNIKSMRDDAAHFADIIVQCCEALREALGEFHNFRKSQTLHGLIVEINRMEEEGDALFTSATRKLYVEGKDPLEVYGWGRTLHYMEICCDACEDVADVIESVMMKNS